MMLLKYARDFPSRLNACLLAPDESVGAFPIADSDASGDIPGALLLQSHWRLSLYWCRLRAGVRTALTNSDQFAPCLLHSPAVFGGAHSLKMRRSNAERIEAQVVDGQSCGNDPYSQLISQAVRTNDARVAVLQTSVPVAIGVAGPKPARPKIRPQRRGWPVLIHAFTEAISNVLQWAWLRGTNASGAVLTEPMHWAQAASRMTCNQASTAFNSAEAANSGTFRTTLERRTTSRPGFAPALVVAPAQVTFLRFSNTAFYGAIHCPNYLISEVPPLWLKTH